MRVCVSISAHLSNRVRLIRDQYRPSLRIRRGPRDARARDARCLARNDAATIGSYLAGHSV